MPDYGDERGFRSRGVPADIGRDRAGGFRSSGPPSNIGRDRAGGFGWNDMRQIIDERMPTAELLGDLPGARGVAPWFRGRDRDTTTVPAGFNAPDRFGRMRPSGATNPYAASINNNPMGGANLGGGWNLYEGAPKVRRRYDWMNQEETPMSSGEYLANRYSGGVGDQFARNAGANEMLENMLMAEAGSEDDDYGPFIPPSVLEMDIFGIDYDPSDEYDFDRRRGYPGYVWGSPPEYSARGGLI